MSSTIIVSKSEERVTKQETEMTNKYSHYFRAIKKCKLNIQFLTDSHSYDVLSSKKEAWGAIRDLG